MSLIVEPKQKQQGGKIYVVAMVMVTMVMVTMAMVTMVMVTMVIVTMDILMWYTFIGLFGSYSSSSSLEGSKSLLSLS